MTPCCRNATTNHQSRKAPRVNMPIPACVRRLFQKNNLTFPENGEVMITPEGPATLRVVIVDKTYTIKGKLKGGWGGKFLNGSRIE